MQTQLNDRARYLGRGIKAARLYGKQRAGRGVIMHRICDSARRAGAGRGGKAVRRLFLHHYRDMLDGQPLLQQLHDDRAGNIIGQVCTYGHTQARELVPDERRKVHLQHVALHDRHVFIFCQSFRQQRRQTLVHLHRHYFFCAPRQLLGQHPHAGADLQHAEVLVNPRRLGDLGADARVDDKILPEFLGERKAVRRAQRFDGGNIRQIHALPPLFSWRNKNAPRPPGCAPRSAVCVVPPPRIQGRDSIYKQFRPALMPQARRPTKRPFRPVRSAKRNPRRPPPKPSCSVTAPGWPGCRCGP